MMKLLLLSRMKAIPNPRLLRPVPLTKEQRSKSPALLQRKPSDRVIRRMASILSIRLVLSMSMAVIRLFMSKKEIPLLSSVKRIVLFPIRKLLMLKNTDIRVPSRFLPLISLAMTKEKANSRKILLRKQPGRTFLVHL